VNLVPIKTEKQTRYLVVGAPATVRLYDKEDSAAK
jgi:hypothetical protein